MNLRRQIAEKALIAFAFALAALNTNAYKLYIVYRMIF